jgi:hypothetical protein
VNKDSKKTIEELYPQMKKIDAEEIQIFIDSFAHSSVGMPS